jgi:hypothetical protein
MDGRVYDKNMKDFASSNEFENKLHGRLAAKQFHIEIFAEGVIQSDDRNDF